MARQGQTIAPDAGMIERIARDAIARLPEAFRAHLDNVVLQIEDFADDETLDALGLEDPFQLSGLYSGRPIGTKSIDDSGTLPDMIHLYRRALLDEWAEGGETLETLVSHVVIHEIGHHFGLSDAQMHALEQEAGHAPE
ncbi:metallopeptidase family protein [Sphingomonas sp. AP4-R1]|uniref:metallopeptidase family protein n=1 Tax=Sphingomonas sp. AP4-R1 TaxID=2735134 RepID=UPI0014938ED3|nr:metallopeptidase family protein [Sphingomonas sp. AP4-R1]QJU60389.1 metallopeptidase family protein [Sphingomonas sp. AP4-R1]